MADDLMASVIYELDTALAKIRAEELEKEREITSIRNERRRLEKMLDLANRSPRKMRRRLPPDEAPVPHVAQETIDLVLTSIKDGKAVVKTEAFKDIPFTFTRNAVASATGLHHTSVDKTFRILRAEGTARIVGQERINQSSRTSHIYALINGDEEKQLAIVAGSDVENG